MMALPWGVPVAECHYSTTRVILMAKNSNHMVGVWRISIYIQINHAIRVDCSETPTTKNSFGGVLYWGEKMTIIIKDFFNLDFGVVSNDLVADVHSLLTYKSTDIRKYMRRIRKILNDIQKKLPPELLKYQSHVERNVMYHVMFRFDNFVSPMTNLTNNVLMQILVSATDLSHKSTRKSDKENFKKITEIVAPMWRKRMGII